MSPHVGGTPSVTTCRRYPKWTLFATSSTYSCRIYCQVVSLAFRSLLSAIYIFIFWFTSLLMSCWATAHSIRNLLLLSHLLSLSWGPKTNILACWNAFTQNDDCFIPLWCLSVHNLFFTSYYTKLLCFITLYCIHMDKLFIKPLFSCDWWFHPENKHKIYHMNRYIIMLSIIST